MDDNMRIMTSYEQKETDVPICIYCDKPVRKKGYYKSVSIFPNANPPWNSGWGGRCENCGHDYACNIHTGIRHNIHSEVSHRSVQFKPANHAFQYFGDEAIVFTGVEILVNEQQFKGENTSCSLFLSLEEIESLVDYLLQNNLIMKQFHWLEDGT